MLEYNATLKSVDGIFIYCLYIVTKHVVNSNKKREKIYKAKNVQVMLIYVILQLKTKSV